MEYDLAARPTVSETFPPNPHPCPARMWRIHGAQSCEVPPLDDLDQPAGKILIWSSRLQALGRLVGCHHAPHANTGTQAHPNTTTSSSLSASYMGWTSGKLVLNELWALHWSLVNVSTPRPPSNILFTPSVSTTKVMASKLYSYPHISCGDFLRNRSEYRV